MRPPKVTQARTVLEHLQPSWAGAGLSTKDSTHDTWGRSVWICCSNLHSTWLIKIERDYGKLRSRWEPSSRVLTLQNNPVIECYQYMNKAQHAVAIGSVLIDHLDVRVEDCAMDLYYGPFNLQNGKDTRHTHRWTGGFTSQALRTDWEYSQLPPIVRFVPRLMEINLRVWVKCGTNVFVSFTGCFVEERTYGFCVPFKFWVASHFKFQEAYRMPPAGTKAARKIVTDGLTQWWNTLSGSSGPFSSYEGSCVWSRGGHPLAKGSRSSLMKSLASYLRCCQQSLVLHSCIIFIYVFLLSIEDHGVYNWDRVALGYGYCMSNCSWHGRLSLPTAQLSLRIVAEASK